jgi:ammonia channel protein AmtB
MMLYAFNLVYIGQVDLNPVTRPFSMASVMSFEYWIWLFKAACSDKFCSFSGHLELTAVLHTSWCNSLYEQLKKEY